MQKTIQYSEKAQKNMMKILELRLITLFSPEFREPSRKELINKIEITLDLIHQFRNVRCTFEKNGAERVYREYTTKLQIMKDLTISIEG
jgi:hypothetical protein